MYLAFALAILAFSLFFLYKYLGPDFWNPDPFRFEDDIWEE